MFANSPKSFTIRRGGYGLHTSHIQEFEVFTSEVETFLWENKGSINPTAYRLFLNNIKQNLADLKKEDFVNPVDKKVKEV